MLLGLCLVGCSQATLLGTPIGSEEAISVIIKMKTGMLELIVVYFSLCIYHFFVYLLYCLPSFFLVCIIIVCLLLFTV